MKHLWLQLPVTGWGGLTSYYVGHLGKWEIIEKWFRVKEETLLRQKSRIERYQSLIALITWLPIIGDVLAIALGFYRVNFIKSALYMLLGRALRFATWISLYYLIGEGILKYKLF